MEKVVVLTAAHKSFDQLGLEGYLPVQVGAALAAQDLGFQRDDEGDNISEKNPQYCELTAQYWAWKNLTDAQIMGLVHYRRYFTTDLYTKNWKDAILTADQIRQLLRQYTIVLPKPVYKLPHNGTLYHDRPRQGQNRHLLLLEEILQRRCPEYMPSFEKFAYGRRVSFGNMLLCSREVFCAYSAWMFPLLEEFERLGKQEGILIPRLCGFMSEYLLCIWADHNIPADKILFLDVVNTEESRSSRGFLLRKLLVKLGIFEPVARVGFAFYYKMKGC